MKNIVSLKERFLSHVQISENLNDCWVWKGSDNGRGYGKFEINKRHCRAHRVSFELFVGPIPENLCVCHSCDNPGCVNPSHLFLGTRQENMDDKVRKNRQSRIRGEKQGLHKLTEELVYQIREMLEQGHSQRKIAKMFGVSQGAIFFIKSGKNWGWLK